MLWKLFRTEINIWQIIAAFVGAFMGSVIMLAAVGFYFDVKAIFDDKEGFWKEEYIIISKRISSDETLRQINNENTEKPTFSLLEIEELKSQKFVSNIVPFTNCSFGVSAYTDSNSPLAGFYTDLFFEAIPTEYIDVNYHNWDWKEGNDFIPVIMPKTYLNLYNFGFATSQNLPQVSEKSASMIKFNLIIHGNNKRQKFDARIVGFSDRINTLLVPKEFLDWGNTNFGNNDASNPSRLIVVANDPSDTNMFQFFKTKNYDVNKAELSNSKALMFLRIIISLVIGIGLIITVLAFWLLITGIMLLLQKNKDNIIKLGLQGYNNKIIARPYYILVLILIIAINLLAILPLHFIRHFYLNQIITLGYEAKQTYYTAIPSLAITFTVFISLICFLNIRFKVNSFLK
ncbi:MAG: hypothetical protein GX879_01180 [Bacteroidales bacterium]|nr:hypothetical protein [Bacteroidales bacterium]